MPTTAIGEINALVGRIRRLVDYGWSVEMGGGSSEYLYRVTAPNGRRIQLHGSPSDPNWYKAVLKQLNDQGFETDEAQAGEDRAALRREKIEADRATAEAKTKRLAAKSAAHAAAVAKASGAPMEIDLKWALTPIRRQETRVVLMTPEAARKILDEINTHNRPPKERRTCELVAAIENDAWSLTHQGVAIDWNGVLQDGQHRLEAIARTDRTVPIMVSIGMDPDNFAKIDNGSLRSARDVLAIRGEVAATALAATAKMIIQHQLWGADLHHRHRNYSVRNDEVSSAMDEFGDELNIAVLRAQRIRREGIKVSVSGIAAAIFLISRQLPVNDERVEKFLDDFETGSDIGTDDPVRLLRRVLIRSAGDRTHKMDAYQVMALVIKAWNHRAKSTRKLEVLVFRGASESFPHPFLPPPIDIDKPEYAEQSA